jgi:preprotein translocase subunit SecE
VARDRKRAKQRRQRRAPDGASALSPAQPTRADLPGALGHASGEVDEFDAALVRGAGSSAVPGVIPDSPALVDEPSDGDADPVGAGLVASGGPGGAGRGGSSGGGGGGGGDGSDSDGVDGALPAPRRDTHQPLPTRAVGFLRASWAELQRVQWPDRRQVTQATAVVLGFVAIAGAYLGAADFVAKEIVNAIL